MPTWFYRSYLSVGAGYELVGETSATTFTVPV
jgi:hypothetical protein